MKNRQVQAILLMILAAGLGGCTPVQLVRKLIAPEKVLPVFTPADVMTLIMVDDPRGELGGIMNMAVLADRMMQDMKVHEVVHTFVPTEQLHTLKDQLGAEYDKAPIDRIGRKLGAKQVIYVKIRLLTLEAAPSMWQPRAVTSVKIIDVDQGRRVFPSSVEGDSPLAYDFKSSMKYRFEEQAAAAIKAQVLREFSQRIGRDGARLFYTYEKDPPGRIYEK